MKDMFGNKIEENVLLRDKYIEPPFSVLDSKSGSWQNRKRLWKSLGIKSEVGRDKLLTYGNMAIDKYRDKEERVLDLQIANFNSSVFDPVLCELIYNWFCEKSGNILDPFAGGSVRGIVANYLGYKYTGIDLSEKQVESNKEQAETILNKNNLPLWIIGNSNKVLDSLNNKYDLIFSCPPYFNLEKYSDLKEDLSNMNYQDFLSVYESIIKKSCNLLKENCFACFVVGEVRNKHGNYIGFVSDTIKAFQKAEMEYYNEAILLNVIASASMRANNNMNGKKLTKIHQNVLIFKKC